MGKVIDFTARRVARVGADARLPLTVQATQDAVALVVPGFEWWLVPSQAEELADDLKRMALAARAFGKGPRPRGA